MRGGGVSFDIGEALRPIVGEAHVRVGEGLRPYRLGAMDPKAAVFPADEGQVSQVLAFAWRERLRVVPWGGGAHQALGHAPQGYDLALDLGRMNRVLEHEPGDMTATVECGVRMADLQAHVEKCGQFFPVDPPMANRATLGGVLATNQNGPLRCRYGALRDLTLGIRMVHADGTITKGGANVVKNATAYDITKLYVGSLGTLGVIVAASLRLYPRPAVEGAWEVTLTDAEQGQALATRILASECVPTRVELLDRGDGRASLFVSCAGVPEAVEAQAVAFGEMAGELRCAPLPIAEPEGTWRALSDFPWRPLGIEARPHRAIWRVGVLPNACAQGIHAIRKAAGAGGVVSMAASVACGLIRGEIAADGVDNLASCLDAARDTAIGMGGYLVILDAPAAVRAKIDVWGPASDGLSLMGQLKGAFDSQRILNPGRFTGGI